jgi:hypothetical protein
VKLPCMTQAKLDLAPIYDNKVPLHASRGSVCMHASRNSQRLFHKQAS